MRQYEEMTRTVNELVGLQCNGCGRCIPVRNGLAGESVVFIQHRYEYPSKQDGTVCEFELCEECFENWMNGLQIPANKRR